MEENKENLNNKEYEKEIEIEEVDEKDQAKDNSTKQMLNYHEKFQQEIRKARDGQGKYREELLEQCRFCPFTMIADERLLIASHIKPWAASNDKEKVDPFNGYILSPL